MNELLLIPAFFAITGAIGILRLPDVYNRVHASTLISVGGTILLSFILIADLFRAEPTISAKLLLIIFLTALTTSTSSHLVGNAAHHTQIKPWRRSR